MKAWRSLLVSAHQPIMDAIKVLNDHVQFAVVVDSESKLLGTITDGDLRRGILKGLDLNKNLVIEIMNTSPISAKDNSSMAQIYTKLKKLESNVTFIPLVDKNKVVTGIFTLGEEPEESNSTIPVVIMAGGLGSRLGEMTKSCPKPLLKINGVPILEIIISNLKKYKFHDFHISVNYKSEMIEDYFKSGEEHDVSISYIRENKKLGTAGCLSLVDFSAENIIVVNGDVLTQVNFQALLDFHLANKSLATMCVREYSYTIPFGVVTADDGVITAIEEKPSASVFVNAGIYVLNKSVLEMIPKDQYFDMPSLFKSVMDRSKKSAMVYPVHEYWTDIGQKEDFLKAQLDYPGSSDKA